MSATITLDATNANRTRWGGFLLLVAAAGTALGTFLGHLPFPTGLPADHAEAARAIVANSGVYTAASWVLLTASLLGAVGCLFLVTRHVPSASGFPGSAFWLATGLGFLFLTGLFAFRATGFMVLAQNQGTLPVAFEAARSTLVLLRVLGTFLVFGGLLGVFFGESRAQGAALPSALSTAVALCCGVGIVAQALTLMAATATTGTFLGYVIYPTCVLLVPFALKLAWPGMSFVWSAPLAGPEAEA